MNDKNRGMRSWAESVIRSRAELRSGELFQKSPEAEGGCGVTGFACTIPVRGKHIYEPSIQMRNRGNGKGGGIAACGLVPEEHKVSRKILDEDYILQVALLDPSALKDVEKKFIEPFFDIDQSGMVATVDDYRDVPFLEVKPPDVVRYFARVKPEVIRRFAEEKGLAGFSDREVEDEFIFQNSFNLNREFYSSLGDKKAFILSHARNLIIMKIVGFAEASVQYYRMEDMRAHVWIAHQRYPTKGRVWHPGGAHPFIGMNEALVHNGDFANYHSVTEYLAQRNLFPQFLTDTEVSVMLFDLMNRVYKYPLEYLIEALAPSTELDFDRLPEGKRKVYREIQALHTHASPDGPWFFIIARNVPQEDSFQLLGITDTAMLRPQVFALQEGEVSIGLVCSEKQAIDATLASLAKEDTRFTPVADMYWNARGGSHTDGGAFLMNIAKDDNGGHTLSITNKFGERVRTPAGQLHCDPTEAVTAPPESDDDLAAAEKFISEMNASGFLGWFRTSVEGMDFNRLRCFVDGVALRTAKKSPAFGIEALTLCMDRRYCTGTKKRSSVLTILRGALGVIFDAQPLFPDATGETEFVRITLASRDALRPPKGNERTLLIDAKGFAAEGEGCDARLANAAYTFGWKSLIHYNPKGTRFHAAGFGPETSGLRIDCYDNPGDYLGSGMDGLEAYVHGNAQDQLCQISKSGKLVVYGDVGQTFLYGAKGGEIYVLGNVAGRPMINAVGRPRVIINGTALDFLAESFMAGIPLEGGGFAIVNGLKFDENGNVTALEQPYPGSNLLSLASGGAIYVRDPHKTLVDEQLNGCVYEKLTEADWKLMLPYLKENERLFGIEIERDLLTVDGVQKNPWRVYTKVLPLKNATLAEELEEQETE
jgi:glutamate synthase domain-containing protein 1/glutamate synthase domain-containing protein 3